MSVFRGSGVALVTPFHEDKSINFEMLEYLVERQIAGHTPKPIILYNVPSRTGCNLCFGQFVAEKYS